MFLTLVGFLLYKTGAACALRKRGCSAVGGEVLALLLPMCYYVMDTTVRDILSDIRKCSVPELCQGVPVEVMRDPDAVLLFGSLAEFNFVELTVARISGHTWVPITEKGSAVLVRSYDARMDPVLLRAKVIQSSEEKCTVGELEKISRKPRREHIRHAPCPSANVCALDNMILIQPQPCRLLNISAGGVCIEAGHIYAVGQTLRLSVPVAGEDRCESYSCRVVRAAPGTDGRFEYGLVFLPAHQRS